VYDVEGLALFSFRNEKYLVASIQGNFSYAIFRIGEPDQYITSFVIKDGNVDGVEETDGLEAISLPLGKKYEQGLLVVQDGFNTSGDMAQSQNFKYISLNKITELLQKQ